MNSSWCYRLLDFYRLSFIMKVSFVYITLIVCSQQPLRGNTYSRQELDKLVTIGADNETLSALLQKLKAQTELSFVFPSDYSGITFGKETRTVREVLDLALRGTNLAYTLKDGTVIIYEQSKEKSKKKQDGETEASDSNNKNDALVATVSGVVREASSQEPLPGVSITVKNTTRGATTDGSGKFVIDAGDDDVLVFSFIGFKSYETRVGGRTIIDVILEEEASMLKEVVVHTGYYDVKEKEKTGSISKVTSDVIGKQPVTNPLGALQGRMPGVFIQQTTGVPGGDFKIQIRGLNSLRRVGNDPLYIVDGVPFSTEKVSSHHTGGQLLSEGGGVSPLTSINSADIESIEVLKDADATAIYGSRGANGVVLITTKKGKAGRTKIDVNYYAGVAKPRLQKLLNTKQYLTMRREAFANDNLTPTANPDDDGSDGNLYAQDLMVWDTTRYTDWQKMFLGNTAKTTSIQTSVSGGGEKTQFLMSAGYYNETSVFPGEHKFRKLSSHLSLNHTSEDENFFVNVSISGSQDTHDQPRGDFSNTALRLAPNAPKLYNENGTLNWEYHPITGQPTWKNPMAKSEATYTGDVNNLITKSTLGYEIIDGLKIQSSIGYNRLASEELSLYPSTQFAPGTGIEVSSVNASNGRTNSWIVEPQLSWERKIAKGQFSFLLGCTYQEQDHKRLATQYEDFPSNGLLQDLSAAGIRRTNEYVVSMYKYAALYGRVNYNWNGKYIINLTGRRDGSSRFGPGRQFANFGAIGAAWIFSEDSFSKNYLPFLSFGKLRGSFGITGSDQIGDYQFLDTYEAPQGINSYDGVTALDPTRLYNPVFGWESNKKMEGALELGFLDDRIALTLGYYRNRSSNQLVNYTLPATTGFNGIQANLDATVQNTGIEIEITTINVRTNDLTWTTSLNFTVPRNKLISFPNLDSSSYSDTYIIGQPIYIQKFYEFTGVDPETGLYTARDYNNDGVISRIADAKKAMFVGQDFYGGINNTIRYKGWILDIFLQVVSQTGRGPTFANGFQDVNFSVEFYNDQWRKPGDKTAIQRPVTDYTSGGPSGEGGSLPYYVYSDAVVVDASFIRQKIVSLSYQFPQKWLKGISHCMAYIRGQNLGVLTNYKGSDPETQSMHHLAPLRTITIGVILTL
jgi:TonB-dependent starch-binding outer membrane protein SusC